MDPKFVIKYALQKDVIKSVKDSISQICQVFNNSSEHDGFIDPQSTMETLALLALIAVEKGDASVLGNILPSSEEIIKEYDAIIQEIRNEIQDCSR